MSKFSIVIIIILLSVAVTLISGILLPTYFSRQILELRKELNYQNSNSKYSLQANIVPITEKQNKNSVLSQNIEIEELGSALTNNSIQSPGIVKKRNKRQAVSDNDYFKWNFNFNLTEHRNHALQETSETEPGTSQKIKPLGISIFTEGDAKRKAAFSDIQYSLKAVEYFFKYLFNAGNFTHEDNEVEARHSDVDISKHDARSGTEPPVKGREGKFFNLGSLNIFGFRRSPEKTSSATPTATDSFFEKDELMITESPQIDIFTGNSQKIPHLLSSQAQALISEESSNVSGSNLPGKTEDGECIDCSAEVLETPVISNTTDQTNDLSVTEAIPTEFTEEFLEMFCMRVVNKVGVSQHLSDSEDENIDSNKNIPDEHDTESSPENPFSDILPTLVSGKEQNPHFITEDFINDALISESDREKKFLSLNSFLGFGSGRVAADETNDTRSEIFANAVDLSNLPTLLDCENYFRKKNIKMFSKPNLMDIQSDPKIKFSDFANATVSSKVIEQLHILTDLKTNLSSSVETTAKNSDAITKSVFVKTFENDGSTLKEASNEMLLTESNDLIENPKVSIPSANISEDQDTEIQKDSRFISIFGFGSGIGEPRSLETVFGTDKIEELGSGDLRSLETVNLGSDKNENFGSGDSRSFSTSLLSGDKSELGSGGPRSFWTTPFGNNRNEIGSGDSRSLEEKFFENELSELGSGELKSLENTSGSDRNEFGSGGSRLLETITFGTERNEFGSGNSRSFEETVFVTEITVLGSGEFRSLENETFESDKNEFGSGDTRSLETAPSDEFGSGESRSLETAPSGEFGSGESRSLETLPFGIERDEFGSGDPRSLATVPLDEFGSGESRSLETAPSGEFGSGESRSLETAPSGEFGSGESRSLETAPSDEFGSGESRSLETATFGTARNKFGIGDSRSLEETFGTELSELGSGELRSLENETFKKNISEFESGESGLHGETEFKTEISELGSGVFRSFRNEASVTDKNIFGSGDSFKQTSDLHEELAGSGDGREFPAENEVLKNEKQCENCTDEFTTDKLLDCDNDECKKNSNEKDGRLFEVHNSVKKSGCGEDCLKTDEVENEITDFKTASSDNHGQNCQDCNKNINIMNRNMTLIDVSSSCDECNSSTLNSDRLQQIFQTESVIIHANQGKSDKNFETSINASSSDTNDLTDKDVDSKIRNGTEKLEQTADRNNLKFLGPIFLTGSGDGGLFGDSGGPIILEEEESTNANNKDNIVAKNLDSEIQNGNPHEHTTEKNSQRFLGPIFLTGSGDGGLFEDSGGQINPIEEETTVKSQNFSHRKARLNDPLRFSEAVHESSVQKSKQDRPINGNMTAGQFTSPVAPSRRRGRVDDEIDKHCDDCDYDYEDFLENYQKNQNITDNHINKDINKFEKRINTQSVREIPLTNASRNPATVSTDLNQNKMSIFPNFTKSHFQTRPCTAARECNVTLNERCISINMSRVCGCSKGYTRSKETGKCVVKKIVQTSIKLPSEHFEDDLKNPFSHNFQQKRKSSIELMILLLQHDPEMLKVLSQIEEVKFSNGSLVVTLSLVFAAENKSEAQLVKRLEDDLQIALRNETLLKNAALNISDASLVSVDGEIDYCKSSELNYCSEHAYCVSNPALPASYACHCKEHYRDASFDPHRFGEICLAKCPREYCGPYGHCELLANDEKMCLCSGLYFGRRCEVPGLYVLIILGCVGFISITMLIMVVCRRRCSKFSYQDSQAHGSVENVTNSNVNGKISDTIALEENIGTARFMSISTPVPHPTIKVIRPTVTESGSSYDFDSTFDSNQSALKTEGNTAV